MNKFESAIGDPEVFLRDLGPKADKFAEVLGVKHFELKDIRLFFKSREFDIPVGELNLALAAFGTLLVDHYAQTLKLRGIFKKKLMVESKGFSCEFLDLFYRCVFEGLDLAPEGEGLARKM